MRKILVIGSGGAGKSTFARQLGRALQLEVIHLDSIYWSPGWVEMPKPEWRRTVEALTARESWVMDGNYSGTLELRLAACDTVIFLDLPRLLCLWRVLKRIVRYRGRSRLDMGAGCPERFDWTFVRWVWGYPTRTRPKIIGLLEESRELRHVIRLRSRAEVREFLARAVEDKETLCGSGDELSPYMT
jgi:adenylate kinase family enzyme